ncbi:MAG TPA: PIN domain-containing protein [Tepidisphaeraceae bacterium]|jgi:predicted nucleic acid-binding protein|nr:PIN domain-containing protein [Tepidisphaeraceae bacterium]
MTSIDSLAGRHAYLDTNVFIYTLNAFPTLAPILTRLFTIIDIGQLQAITSELTLAELLVKPMRDGDIHAQQTCQSILLNNPRLTLMPIARHTLIESARLRAGSTLKLPDALHLATAILSGCDIFLTNDTHFRLPTSPINILLLSDLVP